MTMFEGSPDHRVSATADEADGPRDVELDRSESGRSGPPCESCGRPADLRLDDGSLWCLACDASARNLGYAWFIEGRFPEVAS